MPYIERAPLDRLQAYINDIPTLPYNNPSRSGLMDLGLDHQLDTEWPFHFAKSYRDLQHLVVHYLNPQLGFDTSICRPWEWLTDGIVVDFGCGGGDEIYEVPALATFLGIHGISTHGVDVATPHELFTKYFTFYNADLTDLLEAENPWCVLSGLESLQGKVRLFISQRMMIHDPSPLLKETLRKKGYPDNDMIPLATHIKYIAHHLLADGGIAVINYDDPETGIEKHVYQKTEDRLELLANPR